jgi:hypothetical protein
MQDIDRLISDLLEHGWPPENIQRLLSLTLSPLDISMRIAQAERDLFWRNILAEVWTLLEPLHDLRQAWLKEQTAEVRNDS